MNPDNHQSAATPASTTAAAAAKIRLLIVDDHEVVRTGVKTLMSRQPGIEVVGESGSIANAISEAIRLKPDVVILDIRLPDGSGVDACKQISALVPAPKILILTSFADDDLVYRAVSSGANGYLLKEVIGDSLVQAVRDVARGETVLDPAVTRHVVAKMRDNQDPSRKSLDVLSPQERRILALVAEGKTNKEIAVDMQLSDKTVKNYLSNLLEKLQMNRRSQAAVFYIKSTTPSSSH